MGDAEREEALRALGDHMSAGRLDIEEYGDRTARVTASKTRGELIELFRDLPDPKPSFSPQVQQPQPPPAAPARPPAIQRWATSRPALRAYMAVIPLVWIGAVVLFFGLRTPFVFVLPILVMIAGSRIWGEDWHAERRAQRRQRDHWRYHTKHHHKYWKNRGRY